jgi:single-strand DNA-binding protein
MAGSLNKVILIGNLGADPEIREMPDGTKMAKFSIATSERYTNKAGEKISNTEWHNIVLWRGTAEVAEKYLRKGDSVCIEGKLKTRSWEDESGNKKYATDVQGDSMTMLGSKKDSENSNMGYTPPPNQNNNRSEENLTSSDSKEQNESVDDLPFSN